MTALHDDALSSLRAWTAPTRPQERLRRRFVSHLEAHADGVERTCRPDHLTAGVLVLSHDRSQVLLTLHAKARRWFQFGGHLEPGDRTLAEAALREGREESGLGDIALDPVPVHLDEHAVDFCGSQGRVQGHAHHLDVRFVAVAPLGAQPAVSEESLDVVWWPVGDLPDAELTDLVAAGLDRVG